MFFNLEFFTQHYSHSISINRILYPMVILILSDVRLPFDGSDVIQVSANGNTIPTLATWPTSDAVTVPISFVPAAAQVGCVTVLLRQPYASV